MKKIKKIYYIFVFAIIFNLLYFTTINVKAFNTDESDPTSQMTYYVESKENIIYYDIEADSFEVVYLETGLFKIYKGEQYPLTRGYIIRNDEEIFYSVPNSDVYPFSMFSDNLAIILTSNLEWFCFLYDYDENQYAYYNESENKYYFVDIEFDYDFYSFERNYQLYSKQFDGDVSNKITRSEYFENLKDNIGINETGSCAYVSLGILLGYYDIFVNDNIIENDEMYLSGKATKDEIEGLNEETYVKSETINNSFDIENCLESPGTTNAFHNFLLYEIGRKHFDYHDDTAPETSCDGVNIYEIVNVLDYYLSSYRNFDHNDYNIEFYSNENQIINALDDNIPVFLACNSWSKDFIFTFSSGSGYINKNVIDTYLNAGHALVAYGYEITDDGIFFKCHAGWESDTYNDYSDEIILSFGDDEIDAFSINFNTQHICSDAYINNISTSEKQHFCGGCGAIFIDEVALNCQTEPYEDSLYLQQNQTIIYELDLECDTRYDFEVESPNLLSVGLYDENMTLVSEFLYIQGTNNNYYYFNVQDLEEGRYHIKVNLASGSSSCNINVTLDHRPTSPEEILVNEPVDVLEHLHYSSNAYYFMRNKPGIYEVVLTGISSNGTIIYPEGTITIVSGDNVVQKYVFTEEDYDNPATSLNGSNTMTWLVDDYANYYIIIEISSTGLTSLQLEVRELETFTLSASDEFSEISQLVNGDKFEILDVERTGEYNVQATYTGSQTDDMLFVILRKNSDGLFEEVDGGLFNNTTNFETDVLLNTGEQIYIGYFNGNGNGTFSLNIERNVSNTFSLMTDPNGNVTVGSEVSLNNGEYGGTTLTQGYTRIVYLGIDAPYIQSRTQYNWYTTDSSVAIVSAYGTVTATATWTGSQAYKTVVIRAVYKSNPTIVGEITLTVYKDTNTAIEVLTQYGMDVRGDGSQGTEVTVLHESPISIGVMPDVEIHKGYTRYICLGSDSPSNIIQHFTWSIDRQDGETGNATVSQYGVIKGTTEGYITIKGVYKYNPRYVIYITVKVK